MFQRYNAEIWPVAQRDKESRHATRCRVILQPISEAAVKGMTDANNDIEKREEGSRTHLEDIFVDFKNYLNS